jgi:hypothetical protein
MTPAWDGVDLSTIVPLDFAGACVRTDGAAVPAAGARRVGPVSCTTGGGSVVFGSVGFDSLVAGGGLTFCSLYCPG